MTVVRKSEYCNTCHDYHPRFLSGCPEKKPERSINDIDQRLVAAVINPNDVVQLANKYPNDQELGRELRRFLQASADKYLF